MADHPDFVCDGATDGVCGLHSVTEERRNTDRTRLSDLRVDFERHKDDCNKSEEKMKEKVNDLESFKNKLLGLGILGTIIIGGAYGYTYGHVVSTDARHRVIEGRFDTVSSRVNENKTDLAVLVSKLDTTNERLREIAEIMRKNEPDYKVK